MQQTELKKLATDQLDYFTEDGHKVYQSQWREQTFRIPEEIVREDEPFTVLDVGGANGRFSDRLLEEYPQARAVVLDNSEYLLAQNRPHDRKELVLGSATEMPTCLEGQHFDFIFVNCLLHHIVTNRYDQTRALIAGVLNDLADRLTERGRLSIWENIFEGFIWPDWPGRAIFEITSIKRLAVLAKKLGANTAGVGVCFLSREQWQKELEAAGLEILDAGWQSMQLPLYQRLPLTIGTTGATHMWCAKSEPSQTSEKELL